MAALMSSTYCAKVDNWLYLNCCFTSMQMWCMPPSGFLSRNDCIGLLSPSGCSNYGDAHMIEIFIVKPHYLNLGIAQINKYSSDPMSW